MHLTTVYFALALAPQQPDSSAPPWRQYEAAWQKLAKAASGAAVGYAAATDEYREAFETSP